MTPEEIIFSFDSAADKIRQLRPTARQQIADIKKSIPGALTRWAIGEVSDTHVDELFRQIQFWNNILARLDDNTISTVLNTIAHRKNAALREAAKQA